MVQLSVNGESSVFPSTMYRGEAFSVAMERNSSGDGTGGIDTVLASMVENTSTEAGYGDVSVEVGDHVLTVYRTYFPPTPENLSSPLSNTSRNPVQVLAENVSKGELQQLSPQSVAANMQGTVPSSISTGEHTITVVAGELSEDGSTPIVQNDASNLTWNTVDDTLTSKVQVAENPNVDNQQTADKEPKYNKNLSLMVGALIGGAATTAGAYYLSSGGDN